MPRHRLATESVGHFGLDPDQTRYVEQRNDDAQRVRSTKTRMDHENEFDETRKLRKIHVLKENREPRLSKSEPVRVSAADVVRQFSRYADLALISPVIVSKHGRERNVILSYAEYSRLMKRDLVAFKSGDTPDEFIADLENFVKDTGKQRE